MGSTTVFAPPPDSMATVDPVTGQTIAPMNAPQYAQPAMNFAPQGAHMDPEMQAAAVHHGRLATAMNAVGNLLGGARHLEVQQNPDGTVDVRPIESTPGQKWGRIAAAALQGAASGFAAGQGPGGQARAFAAGLDRSLAATQQQQDRTLQEAQRQENQNRQRQLFNANMAMMHQPLIKSTFDNQTSRVRFGQEQIKFATDLKKQMDDMGATLAGTYSTPEELYAHANGNPQAIDAHVGKNGMLVPVPTYDESGNVTGGSLFIIPEDRRHQLNDVAIDIPFTTTVTNSQGRAETKTVWQHIDKGMMDWEHILAAQQGALVQGNNATISAAELGIKQDANARAEAAAPGERAQRQAQTNLANVQAELAPRALDIKELQAQNANSRGRRQDILYHDRTYIKPAEEGEVNYNLARDAYNEYLRYGGHPPTGAQSMQLLAQHINTTFGTGRARQTKSMIEQHLGARGISDAAEVAVNRLRDGQELSRAQMTAFMGMIADARKQRWSVAAREAQRLSVPVDFLPDDLMGLNAAASPTDQAARAPIAAPVAPAAPPAVGTIIDGHRFMGGDPGNQANWKAVP